VGILNEVNPFCRIEIWFPVAVGECVLDVDAMAQVPIEIVLVQAQGEPPPARDAPLREFVPYMPVSGHQEKAGEVCECYFQLAKFLFPPHQPLRA
jgi:hypothetical protein